MYNINSTQLIIPRCIHIFTDWFRVVITLELRCTELSSDTLGRSITDIELVMADGKRSSGSVIPDIIP